MAPIREHGGPEVAPVGFQEVRLGEGAVLYQGGKLVDDFEDGNLDEYTEFVNEEEQSTTYSSITTESYEGDYAVDIGFTSEQGNINLISSPGDGLPRYLGVGTTIRYYQRHVGDDWRGGLLFGSDESPGDAYRIDAVPRNDDELNIQRKSDGDLTQIASTSLPLNNHLDEWLEFEVEYRTGENNDVVAVTVRTLDGTEIASTSTTDTTYSGPDVGLASSGLEDAGGGIRFDLIEVISED